MWKDVFSPTVDSSNTSVAALSSSSSSSASLSSISSSLKHPIDATLHPPSNMTDAMPHWNNLTDFEQFCGNSPLWDTDLLLTSPYPRFTPCFIQVGLAWIPCLLYMFMAPAYIVYIARHSTDPIKQSFIIILKMICTIILMGITIGTIVLKAMDENQESVTDALYVSEGLKAFCFMLSLYISHTERQRGMVTSPLTWTFLLLLLIASLVPFYSNLMENTLHTDLTGSILFYVYFAFIFFTFILWSFAEPKREYQHLTDVNTRYPSPEPTASIPSRISFAWITSLIILGFRRSVEEDDVYDLIPSDKLHNLVPDYLTAWKEEEARVKEYNSKVKPPKTPKDPSKRKEKVLQDETKSPKSPYKSASVFRALMSTDGLGLLCALCVKTAFDLLRFVTPMITEALIDFTTHRDKYYEWRGYVLALSFLVVNFIASTGSNLAIFYTKRIGFKIRAIMVNAIYRKSLTAASIGDETTRGEVVNLMSVDCERVIMVSEHIHYIFSTPAQIILAFYLLFQQLGVAALAGMALMFLTIPLNTFTGHLFAKWQVAVMKHKDERMSLLAEVLNGIKVLKLYAWEPSFQEKLSGLRAKEMSYIKKSFRIEPILMYVVMAMPSMVQLVSYGAYIADKGYLDPSVAFVSLQLFNMLNEPLTLLPLIAPFMVQTMISMRRISAYLNRSDIECDAVHHDPNSKNAINIHHGDFTWSVDRAMPTLRNINLEVAPGSLVAVVGTVGSGKSSLLSAMLGEMEKVAGTVTVKGSIAYVPQQAWIQNGALRDNIIFGKGFDKKKYDQIIGACALKPDIAILPGGDETEIGEKGINISGGQKQRVSLARAVYSDRDIFLMDDPLSAVDSHVGKHIFKQVVGKGGLLKHKTRVLVTHGVQWLPTMDKIFVLSNGIISESGSYMELMDKNGDFAQFLKEYAQDNDNESSYDGSVEEENVINREEFQLPTPPDSRKILWSEIETSFSEKSHEPQWISPPTHRRTTSCGAMPPDDHHEENRRWNSIGDLSGSNLGMSSLMHSEKAGIKLVEDEMGVVGKVKSQVYLYYVQEMGSLLCFISMLLFLFYGGISVFSSVWLTKWTDDQYLLNVTNKYKEEYSDKTREYLLVYAGASIVQGVFILISGFLMAEAAAHACHSLHKNVLVNVMRSPMSFFDTTPIGRILNRFALDIEVLDDALPLTLREAMIYFCILVVTISNITYGTPMFLAALVPLTLVYICILAVYTPTIRQLRRIISVTRSPIFVHFSETLAGTASIRAYECQDRFISESMDMQDYNRKFYFCSLVGASWLSFSLQVLGNLIIFAAAMFAVTSKGISPSIVGLIVSFAPLITALLEKLVTHISLLETTLVSVERIKEYTISTPEAEWILEDNRPRDDWPEEGGIVFDNYQTRYRPGLELVLKGINCTINGGEKIGIVGRTGAGKSSMMVGLFRIIESAGGRIVIDGMDVSQIGLHDLRNKITILPQDPVVFSGSLRINLDPFDKYSEPELWNALEHSYLKEFVEELPERLEYECGEEGSNLSVGQRQLVCLARTLLRKTKILVLDEATAAVDMETDDLIQKTIRREFKDCTILTIAHRLNTILDYDRVMVLDNGFIKELDSPQTLLKDENSIFHSMAKDAGIL